MAKNQDNIRAKIMQKIKTVPAVLYNLSMCDSVFMSVVRNQHYDAWEIAIPSAGVAFNEQYLFVYDKERYGHNVKAKRHIRISVIVAQHMADFLADKLLVETLMKDVLQTAVKKQEKP